MNEDQKIERISQLLSSAYRTSNKCDENMRRLNEMMLELKGIIATVRPRAKRNDWYGEELSGDGTVLCKKCVDGNIINAHDKFQIEYESDK